MAESKDSRASTLADRLRERIKHDGPIAFHDWMQAALYDERDGYYRRQGRVRQGREGDYRTAPETSPLFGATFGNYFAACHRELGTPQSWTIAEVGAGRGDFAHALLTTLQKRFPKVFDATHFVIDETSDDAKQIANQKLTDFTDRLEFRALSGISQPFVGIIFCNELIDAFPVHRVTGRQGALRELFVGTNDSGEFVWIEDDLTRPVADYCGRIRLQLSEGQIYEVNLEAENFVVQAASLLESGFMIMVDYGADRTDLLNASHRFAGTLRSFHRHQMIDDVLWHPGEQDLTTTVDWTQIQEAGMRLGLETVRRQSLDQFLLAEGLLDHLSRLTAHLDDDASRLNLNARARELIMPNGMAAYFQVLVQKKVRTGSGSDRAFSY